MTWNEFTDNVLKGFTTKDEGFSVKKQMAVVIVTNLLALTWAKTDNTLLLAVLTIWLGFVTSLIITGAVEKNITAVNDTKKTIAENNK